MIEKKEQLGMNPSTAGHRLCKDLLFKFAVAQDPLCYRCQKPLTRDTFSIDHKEPWMYSEDPLKLFFDLDNIGFSHLRCNAGAGRYTGPTYTKSERLERRRQSNRKSWTSEKRRIYYQNSGK